MIGDAALIPNPALGVFEAVIGEWRTTGSHPLVPGTIFHGSASFAWHLGGAFVLMRTEMRESEIPDAVAVIGSDDAAGSITMNYVDERGVSRRYDVEFDGDRLTWSRNEAGFAQRQTLVLTADRSRMAGRGHMRRGDGEWEGDLSLDYERVG